MAVREGVEITTFRSDHEYADFRRPHHVEFGDRVEVDLARRDFTANAIAWGGAPGRGAGHRRSRTTAGPTRNGGVLRAVGDPAVRFGEDALRMLRAARLAARPRLHDRAGHARGHDRVGGAGRPPVGRADRRRARQAPGRARGRRSGCGSWRRRACSHAIAPALDAQRGIAQNKIPGEDLWDHVVRSVDATAAAGRGRTVRWAALFHDIGKPVTAADGHFYGHDVVGAELAGDLLRRWHAPGEIVDDVTHLVRQHMFAYEAAWTDAAVRRFIAKVGPARLDDLFALREADNLGSGVPAEAGALATLRARVGAELAANVVLDLSGLAIRGDDLIRELGIAPGPSVGRILDALLERVMNDPGSNRPETLIALARELASTMDGNVTASAERPAREPSGEAG